MYLYSYLKAEYLYLYLYLRFEYLIQLYCLAWPVITRYKIQEIFLHLSTTFALYFI